MVSAPRVLDVPSCRLGESPLWCPQRDAVYWIDVWGRRLHRLSLPDGSVDRWDLPELPGCVLPLRNGRLALALAGGLVEFDPATGGTQPLVHPARDGAGGRYNDGAVDPAGRIWIGTVEAAPGSATGQLYRIDADGAAAVTVSGLATPNGIAFSPDGTRMYFTITERREIVAFDFDAATGELSARRVIVVDTDCYPDGLVVAEDGTLWSAKWDGWRVSRYDPDGGLIDEIGFPVPNVTSLTFGGPGLDRLFVTTASEDTAATRPGSEGDAGRMYVLDDLPTRGLPDPAAAVDVTG